MKRFASLFVALLVQALWATAVFASHGTLVGDRSLSGRSQLAGASESTEPSDHPANHGEEVSEAARRPAPSGHPNRGAYVSSIAHDSHGQSPGR